MRPQRLAITLAVSCVALAAAASAAPGQMTAQEARAYLQAAGIAVLPDSLPQVIITGDDKAVDALIAAGLDVNAKGSLPQSPLELAAMSCAGGRVAPAVTAHMMDSLIAAGANPNAPGIQGLGPLMLAAQQCDAAVIKRLVAAGAKLDSRTPQGFTPLSMALIVKNYSAAEALVDAGARISPEVGQKLTEGSNDQRLKDLVTRATGT